MNYIDIFVDKLLTDTPDSGYTLAGWDIHNQGLIEIIRLRGLEQFKYQNGRNLFYIVFNTMVSLVSSLIPLVANNRL